MNDEKRRPSWAQIRDKFAKLLQILALYLDDLLLVAGGGCLIRAAWEGLGRPYGLAVAGIFLCVLALVVARSRRGGGR